MRSGKLELPPEDAHFKDTETYQQQQRHTALKHVTHYRTAVDIGAHVGIHTVHLAHDFDTVWAIEPINTQYLRKNTEHLTNVKVIEAGVSDKATTLYAHNPKESNTGAWELTRITTSKTVNVIALDSLEIQDVDLVKIDTQGLEQSVLEGARETISKYKPVLWIEDRGCTLLEYLKQTHNYGLVDNYNKDMIYCSKDRK